MDAKREAHHHYSQSNQTHKPSLPEGNAFGEQSSQYRYNQTAHSSVHRNTEPLAFDEIRIPKTQELRGSPHRHSLLCRNHVLRPKSRAPEAMGSGSLAL